jgi:O-antigen ligase
MTTFFEELKQNTKTYNFLLLQMMALPFSIAFGSDYGRPILPVMFLTWLFVVKKSDLGYVFRQKVVIVFMVFIAMHLLSLLWSEHRVNGAQAISRMIRYIFLPMVIYASVMKESSVKYIISAFILGMFINEIISYLIYFDVYETAYSKAHHWPVGFINHIPYSVLVAFTAILILFQAKHMDKGYVRAVYITFFMTMTANLVISSGRTGYAAYFGSLIILLFSYYTLTIKNFLQVLIFPIAVFALAYSLDAGVQARVKASVDAVEQINTDKNYDTSSGARIALYSVAQDILDQPENSIIYGAGTGGIKSSLRESIERTGILGGAYKKLDHLHNSQLTAYVRTGLVGLFLLLLFYYFFWRTPVKSKEALFIKQLLFLIVVISTFGDVILSIKETMLFFGIFAGLVIFDGRLRADTT